MTRIESVKERLVRYLAYKRIGQNRFEREAGISNGYISHLVHAPSATHLMKILVAAPDLNKDWLLTGDGNMLIDDVEKEEEGEKIPLLPVSAIGGSLSDDDPSVMLRDCESVLSPIKNAQMAIRVSGDSMYPRYPNGSMVFVREVDQSIFVEWGSYYVVNTTNGTIIKRVFKGEGNTIECRSVNPDYQTFNVPISEVRKMYKILGALHLE